MSPAVPPISNSIFTAPPDLDRSQVDPISAFKGTIPTGNLEGAQFVVVAWRLSAEELEIISRTHMVYLCCLGGLPPHFLSLNFETATYGCAK